MYRVPKIIGDDRFLWDYIPDFKPPKVIDKQPARIAVNDVKFALDIEGGVDVPRFGISITAGLATDTKVRFEIGEARRTLFGPPVDADIRDGLKRLLDRDHGRWKDIEGDFLVMEAWYADSAKVSFISEGDFKAEAAYDKGGIKIDGNLKVTWKGSQELIIEGLSDEVPFALEGKKIRRGFR